MFAEQPTANQYENGPMRITLSENQLSEVLQNIDLDLRSLNADVTTFCKFPHSPEATDDIKTDLLDIHSDLSDIDDLLVDHLRYKKGLQTSSHSLLRLYRECSRLTQKRVAINDLLQSDIKSTKERKKETSLESTSLLMFSVAFPLTAASFTTLIYNNPPALILGACQVYLSLAVLVVGYKTAIAIKSKFSDSSEETCNNQRKTRLVSLDGTVTLNTDIRLSLSEPTAPTQTNGTQLAKNTRHGKNKL